MPDQPSDEPRATRRARAPRTDWRLGGRTVERWREWLLAIALVSLGVSFLAGSLVATLWQSPWAAASALAIIWIGMLVPIVWGFSRSRPAGLLRLRALDLLYGLVLGAVLRTVQGWIEIIAGGSGDFPSYPLIDGALPTGWVLTDLVGAVAIAPVVEELFFRAVLLVALFTLLRRPLGHVTAGVVTLLVTTGVFVLVHGLTGGHALGEVISLSLLGAVCAALVLLTGRIWGAVLTHVVYNATYVALALIGTFWS